MINHLSQILILIFSLVILGCKQKAEPKISDFRVAQHYFEFNTKLENNDTLNIGVNLSMCMWQEYDRLQITKSSDSVFIQLKEKYVVMDDTSFHFDKVFYQLKNDTLNLEKMMTDFDINYQEQTSSPFFVITNPKENDTILLRTTGLGNRGFTIERYQRILAELYPKEFAEYKKRYLPDSDLTQSLPSPASETDFE